MAIEVSEAKIIRTNAFEALVELAAVINGTLVSVSVRRPASLGDEALIKAAIREALNTAGSDLEIPSIDLYAPSRMNGLWSTSAELDDKSKFLKSHTDVPMLYAELIAACIVHWNAFGKKRKAVECQPICDDTPGYNLSNQRHRAEENRPLAGRYDF